MENINLLAEEILRFAFKVHSSLGAGLLQSSYKECPFYKLLKSGFVVEKEKALPLEYEEVKLELGYRIDLLEENKVIVKIKVVEALNNVHTAQVLTYLKLPGCKVGLLSNFNISSFKNGIKRLVL